MIFNQGDKVRVNLNGGTQTGTVHESYNDKTIVIDLDLAAGSNDLYRVTAYPWDVFHIEEED
ncbi:hypothetical protein NELLIE_49 [Arthrobacter phage Nellie]|uniref:Uncharacterized protein n=3 Tax=Jasminevirus adat TaxID=2560299 RepID=A0A249XN90_9CAUD|nr:hypothetical protein FDI47_gp49 [Arthrobacter phage Adat]ASZ72620.1 hypothetical protein ADAT_49 [Arthrobacter phage Adat]ASZ73202.1 hypothetical protein GURGLEFERB_49 [Arthrobacter phage GurgleFerb]ASZ73767.1 hypothetical protein NELLIE_49 [Arthrobacter phage Nellie]